MVKQSRERLYNKRELGIMIKKNNQRQVNNRLSKKKKEKKNIETRKDKAKLKITKELNKRKTTISTITITKQSKTK